MDETGGAHADIGPGAEGLGQLLAGPALRRFRSAARKAEPHRGEILAARQSITVVAEFLAWLADGGKTLADLAQSDLDRWLASPPTTRWRVHVFVAWAADTRRIKHVEMSGRRFGDRPRLGEPDRVAVIRRLLHDETVRLDLRVAGLLVLVLAQPGITLVRLTTAHVHLDPVRIRIGTDQAEIPPPFDGLVERLWHRRAAAALDPPPAAAWMFPGRMLGEPMSAKALRDALRPIGVPVRVSKNTAAAALVAELPAPLVSRVIGVHPSTASRWATETGTGWSAYPARRQ
jgi:hypothetical protein